LEITDTYIRIMKLTDKKRHLFIADSGSVELEAGIIKNGNIRDEGKLAVKIKSLTRQFIGQSKLPCYAVVSLPEEKAFLQVIKMPKLDAEEMRAAVVFQAENYIPLPLEKVYLDFETVPRPLEDFYQCEVLAAAIPKEIVDSRLRVLDAAGVACAAMELESQSVARAALAGKNNELSFMIIHIGDTQSNVIIYSRGSIRFTFAIPVSNRDFVEAISDCANVNRDLAEKLKVKYGIEEFVRPAGKKKSDQQSEKRKIFEALVPKLVDFVQQVQKCARYYQTHEADGDESDGKNFGKIILCGRGADLRGLDEFLLSKINLPVSRLILPIGTDGLAIKKSGFAKSGVCGCAVAAGLALRALAIESAATDGSFQFLMPPKPKRKLKRESKSKIK